MADDGGIGRIKQRLAMIPKNVREAMVPELAVAVTAGNKDVRYAHLVEYGTQEAAAQPFFWPAFRLLRKKITGRIKRAASTAVKKNWGGR